MSVSMSARGQSTVIKCDQSVILCSPHRALKPAMSVNRAARGGYSAMPGLMPGMMAGGMLGGMPLWLNFLPHCQSLERGEKLLFVSVIFNSANHTGVALNQLPFV